jgi:hypothetical protein
MAALLLLFCFALQPNEEVALEETVDLIEVNHFYDDEARLVFDQAIFYDWSCYSNRYQVKAWRLLKDRSQIPTYNYQTGLYECIWMDGKLLRRIKCKIVRESWTQEDPEIQERLLLPKEYRKGLRKLREIKKK